jgi:hypothetical protein
MQFIHDIKEILLKARMKIFQAINSSKVEAYWNIGKRIVREFGKGFSYSNLRNFRQFYLTFPNYEICYTLCSKLTWSHNRLIMRIENEDVRRFYLTEASSNYSFKIPIVFAYRK